MTVAPNTARRRSRRVAVVLVAALAVAACSGDDDDGDSADETSVGSESVDGDGDADTGDDQATENLTNELDAAVERAVSAESEAASLTVELEAAEADLATANETNVQLEADNEAETARADAAEAQVEAFTNLFPVVVESTLEGIDLEQAGTYNLTWSEAYCDTFSTCGTLPVTTQATIVLTPENFLRIQVPGIIDAGLFAVDGSLYGITDSPTALPPCPDGTPRRARITMTIYADDISVDAEGNRTVVGLAGSITVDAPDLGDCSGGLVFYGVELDRAG
jgi:hypothetical protein